MEEIVLFWLNILALNKLNKNRTFIHLYNLHYFLVTAFSFLNQKVPTKNWGPIY